MTRRCSISARPGPVAIFDLDGTLVDSAIGIAAALNAMHGKCTPVSIERVRDLVSFGADRLIKDALGLREYEVDGALARFRALYEIDPCAHDDIYPGAYETLQALNQSGIALGVCTNKPQRLADIVIERIGLASLLPVVVGSTPDRPAKPHPAGLREAIARLSPGGGGCLIGDSMVDAMTAQSAGVPFIHAAFGYGLINAGIPCAGRIACFADLPTALDRIFDGSSIPHVSHVSDVG